MSIKVTIEQYPHASFSREILISRVSDLDLVETRDGPDLADHNFVYEAEYRRNRTETARSYFVHRYGDPLTTLVTEAIAALDAENLVEKPRLVAA